MKIIYFTTSFPKEEKGDTIYTDLAEAIQEAGHEITVVVSEQTSCKNPIELNLERGFSVLRIPTGHYYDVGLLKKGLDALIIPYLMHRGINLYLKETQFDLILLESPPVTNVHLMKWAKKKFQCRAFLMLKDIFPQNAVDLKLIKAHGLLHWYFRRKEKELYRSSDVIGCMSEANRNYLLKHNPKMEENKVVIFPNTKKLKDNMESYGYPMRKFLEISENACVFLFGGNMGKPQCIDFLCKVIKACKGNEKIYFLFVGRGTERYKLERTIWGHRITNARVIGNLPRTEYEQLLKECDVGLILLDPRFTIPNFPSRMLSYMEYAKPILAATDTVSDIKEVIEEAQCGEWVWSGDMEGFIKKVKSMVDQKEELRVQGSNGRQFALKHYSVAASVKQLECLGGNRSEK